MAGRYRLIFEVEQNLNGVRRRLKARVGTLELFERAGPGTRRRGPDTCPENPDEYVVVGRKLLVDDILGIYAEPRHCVGFPAYEF